MFFDVERKLDIRVFNTGMEEVEDKIGAFC
jgi:hypothetical protein